ncbi:MAG: glycerol-3-phosphate 1-O-acyltransferase PlsY [Alphaproteobacteria bacterium]
MIPTDVLVVLIGYLLGAIPFGIFLTRLCGLGDLRKIGSGNIGATNVLRTGNKKVALLTMILDGAKGAVAVCVVRYFYQDLPYEFLEALVVLAGFAAVLGHVFPVWLKFKGGKGVATTFGTLLAVEWQIGLVAIALWLLTAFITKYSSLAALVAFSCAIVISFFGGAPATFLLTVCLTALIFLRHIENIKRLLKGDEGKISFSKKA